MEMPTWSVRLTLECPAGKDPREYAERIQGFVEPGLAELERRPHRPIIDIVVYATVAADTAGDASTMVGDKIRSGLGVENDGIRDLHVSKT